MSKEVLFVVKWDPERGDIWLDTEATSIYASDGNVYDADSDEFCFDEILTARGANYLAKLLQEGDNAARSLANGALEEYDPLHLLYEAAREALKVSAETWFRSTGLAPIEFDFDAALRLQRHEQSPNSSTTVWQSAIIYGYLTRQRSLEEVRSTLSEFESEIESAVDWHAEIGDDDFLETLAWHMQEAKKWLANTPGVAELSVEDQAELFVSTFWAKGSHLPESLDLLRMEPNSNQFDYSEYEGLRVER